MFQYCGKIREKLSFSSTVFIFGITAYFAFVLNISFWRFVFRTVEIDSFGAVILLFPFLSLCLFCCILFLT